MRLTEKQQEIFEELFVRYPVLEKNREDILKAYEVLETCYRTGGKLLVAGNGGSCADAEHIVGELMKGFKKRRPLSEELQRRLAMEDTNHGKELARSLQGSLRAIALDGHPGLSTAFANDVDADMIFAQQRFCTHANLVCRSVCTAACGAAAAVRVHLGQAPVPGAGRRSRSAGDGLAREQGPYRLKLFLCRLSVLFHNRKGDHLTR